MVIIVPYLKDLNILGFIFWNTEKKISCNFFLRCNLLSSYFDYIEAEIIDNEIIAHAKINIIPTIYEDMNTYAILNHICVKPEFRRKHIAKKMLDECFRIAKERNCKCVELWSKNFREAAHALYNKYGFEVVDAKFFAKNID